MKANEQTLSKALHLWESPVIGGNAVVILRQVEPTTVPGHLPGEDRVAVADLDMGTSYFVALSELTVQLRKTEEDDYFYSWCQNNDPEIVEHVLNNRR